MFLFVPKSFLTNVVLMSFEERYSNMTPMKLFLSGSLPPPPSLLFDHTVNKVAIFHFMLLDYIVMRYLDAIKHESRGKFNQVTR